MSDLYVEECLPPCVHVSVHQESIHVRFFWHLLRVIYIEFSMGVWTKLWANISAIMQEKYLEWGQKNSIFQF